MYVCKVYVGVYVYIHAHMCMFVYVCLCMYGSILHLFDSMLQYNYEYYLLFLT